MRCFLLHHPFIPGVNPTWACCMILWVYCWIWFVNILLRIFAPLFLKDTSTMCVCVCVCVCLCLVWVLGSCWLRKMCLGGLPLLQFSGRVQKNRCYIFFECFVEFTSEAIWSWVFVCWEIFDYCFTLLTSNQSNWIFYFFLIQPWKIVCYRNASFASRLSNL